MDDIDWNSGIEHAKDTLKSFPIGKCLNSCCLNLIKDLIDLLDSKKVQPDIYFGEEE